MNWVSTFDFLLDLISRIANLVRSIGWWNGMCVCECVWVCLCALHTSRNHVDTKLIASCHRLVLGAWFQLPNHRKQEINGRKLELFEAVKTIYTYPMLRQSFTDVNSHISLESSKEKSDFFVNGCLSQNQRCSCQNKIQLQQRSGFSRVNLFRQVATPIAAAILKEQFFRREKSLHRWITSVPAVGFYFRAELSS